MSPLLVALLSACTPEPTEPPAPPPCVEGGVAHALSLPSPDPVAAVELQPTATGWLVGWRGTAVALGASRTFTADFAPSAPADDPAVKLELVHGPTLAGGGLTAWVDRSGYPRYRTMLPEGGSSIPPSEVLPPSFPPPARTVSIAIHEARPWALVLRDTAEGPRGVVVDLTSNPWVTAELPAGVLHGVLVEGWDGKASAAWVEADGTVRAAPLDATNGLGEARTLGQAAGITALVGTALASGPAYGWIASGTAWTFEGEGPATELRSGVDALALASPDGRALLAAWRDAPAGEVWLGRTGSRCTPERAQPAGPATLSAPALAAIDGRIGLVWGAHVDGRSRLWGRTFSAPQPPPTTPAPQAAPTP